MRFNYAFQKIVDLKNNERTQAEWILSQAIGQLQTEQGHLAHLHTAREEMQDQLMSVSASKATISEIMLLQQYVEHIDTKIVEKNRHVKQAEEVVVDKQGHLTDKMLEEKVWVKAKEKAHGHFTARLLQKEQQELDEMATNRFQRTF
ncbi:flagellar export protein FliJ [Paenibacillus thalictri]|uniref:Flagellar FliJ protein n=1 Tax=Paenibacillus thalictri TaxID=2527873 RepID=A0A4Q9DTC9_9BACL|nr:flagellar export protein FliJ [Paenibacillus thalictri]TBL77728.1 flagellar export protein FliJ [Paenibacillus thalictri]